MPNRKNLKIGDLIKILKVPDFDLEQREKIINSKNKIDKYEMLDTATVIEKVIEKNPIVKIEEIDEYGKPWFYVKIENSGEEEEHSLAIMEDESWELYYK